MNADTILGCALALSPAVLSAWRDDALPGAEAARVAAHIPTCAACQVRLADYDELARGLAAIRVPEPVGGYGRNPRTRAGNIGNRGRGPKLVGGLGALAAVALLALAFAQVFHVFGQRTGTTATKTPIAATQTPTVPPCQASQLSLTFIEDSLAGGHMSYGFSALNSSDQTCLLRGYPTIYLMDNHGNPRAIAPRQTTRAPTFQTPQPQPITAFPASAKLAPGTSDGAVFYLDWPTTASSGSACAAVGAISLTPNASDGSAISFVPCGLVAVSPFLAAPLPSSNPASAAGLPTCQTSHLLLTFIQGGAATGHAGGLYSLSNTGTSPCALDGYPTLQLLDAKERPVPTQENKTTSAFTFQVNPPQSLPLGIGQSAYFHLDYTDAPSPGQTCITNAAAMTVTPPGDTTSLRTTDAPDPCGAINVSPVQAHP